MNAANEPDALTEAVATYRRLKPKYDRLCLEAEYILHAALDDAAIEYSAISSRAKGETSFEGKIRRKAYKDPINDATDLAGLRIVCLFRADLPRIERVIRDHFEVLERVDKLSSENPDRFGYGAVHFVVCLKVHYAGARYDELQGLKFEIQTRTVLQDAWAIIDHKLVYKGESAIPTQIRRKLNALAGLLEIGDGAFDQIKSDTNTYVAALKEKPTDQFLDQEINLHSVMAFIERMDSKSQENDRREYAEMICANIDRERFSKLADLENAVRRTKKAREALAKDSPIFPAQTVYYSLAFIDPSVRRPFADWMKSLFNKHRHLVED